MLGTVLSSGDMTLSRRKMEVPGAVQLEGVWVLLCAQWESVQAGTWSVPMFKDDCGSVWITAGQAIAVDYLGSSRPSGRLLT